MTESEKREQRIREVEDILYQWEHYVQIEKEYTSAIREINEEINDEREYIKSTSYSNINVKNNSINNPTENQFVEKITKLQKKQKIVINEFDNILKNYIEIRRVFEKLGGLERKIIRCKYFKGLRGKKLLMAINYSKSGYYKKIKTIMAKFIED